MASDRLTCLGRAVLSFHQHTEKEEQKRIEKISKEHLKALTKDTRITHLLCHRLLSLFTHPSCPSTAEGGVSRHIDFEVEKMALLQGGNVGVREDREDRLWLVGVQHVNFGSLYLDMYS